MDEVLKAWLKPEYLPMFAACVALIKWAVVPAIKALMESTAANGTTSLKIAVGSGPALALLYRAIAGPAGWSVAAVMTTILTGLLAGCAAVGLNVATASMRGKDVSIN